MADYLLHIVGMTTPILVLLAFAIPVISKAFNNRRAPFVAAMIGGIYAVVASILAIYMVYKNNNPLVYMYGGWPPHFGIAYEIDYFNGLIGVFTALTMLAIMLYSLWYEHHIDEPTWYFALLLGLEAGILGCLYTGDAFNLFVMIEVLSISAYGLVAYHRDRPEAVEAAAKYILIGAVATTMYFIAVVLLYAGFGTVNMAILSSIAMRPGLPQSLKYLAMLSISLALWVFTYKSALFPNHFWLPDAHPEAPTPISAALSGLVVNVGVYASARFLYTLFGDGSAVSGYRELVLLALFILGTVSGILGALMMMIQRDIKRLLAYSTICHIGIIYIGLAAGFAIGSAEAVKLALMGTSIHIVAHGISKAVLFMASGIFIDAAGSRDLDAMKGVGRRYPLASLSLILGFLNLAGLIPFMGFYSKLLIALSYLKIGFVLGTILIIVISALSIPGYMKAISAIVFGVGEAKEGRVAGRWVEVMLLIMSLSTLFIGMFFQQVAYIFDYSSNSLVSGVQNYVDAVIKEIPPELRGWIP